MLVGWWVFVGLAGGGHLVFLGGVWGHFEEDADIAPAKAFQLQ